MPLLIPFFILNFLKFIFAGKESVPAAICPRKKFKPALQKRRLDNKASADKLR